jgi:acyl-CoA thioesterase-1
MVIQLLLFVLGAGLAWSVVIVLIILFRGSSISIPSIPDTPQTFGSATPLTYIVMGDSTAIAQGCGYDDGYAIASARHLAKNHKVTLVNTAVSGATTKDALHRQLDKAVEYRPDIVLLAVGANDATHFTRHEVVQVSLQTIIDTLRASNGDVRIVVTGSPAMDAVSRFPTGSKWLMRMRTKQINSVFIACAHRSKLVFAPIAAETRSAFLADTTLTASDRFHPNARGYGMWIPIINRALDRALHDH